MSRSKHDLGRPGREPVWQRPLPEIIKAAGPYYFLYGSSKTTYDQLQEKINPFTLEDGLSTKQYHAICALHAEMDQVFGYCCMR